MIGVAFTVFGEIARRELPADQTTAGLTFSLLGILSFAFGVFFSAKEPKQLSRHLETISSRLTVTSAQFIYLFAALLLSILAAKAAGTDQTMNAPMLALAAWGFAMVLAILGSIHPPKKKLRINWTTLIIVACLFLPALALRAWRTDLIPNTLTGDEASGGLFAVEILQGKFDNVFGYGWFSFPALYFYFQAVSITVFGQTTEALRITSALAGALTVGAVYLAGRALYGQRAALIAAIVLAGLHLHIHFSRIGLNNIWDGFWFTAVIGLLWYGWKMDRRTAFLLAGFALGTSQYFYVSVRLLFVLVPAWLVLAALADRKRFQRNSASIALMFLVMLIVFIPLLTNYIKDFDQFLAPMQRVSLIGSWLQNELQLTSQPAWQILANQVWLSIQGFTNTALRHWYTPGIPILQPAAAAFFLLGLVLMLLTWRRLQHWLVWLWLAAFTLSGGLSESTPAAQRYIGVVPAAALVIGYSLSQISKRLADVWIPAKRGLAVVAVLAALLLAAMDINFYFLDFTPRGEYAGENTAVAHHLATYLQTQPPGTQVAFFGAPRMGYRSISTLPYLAPSAIGIDMVLPFDAPENPDLASAPTIFVFLPENEIGVQELAGLYPGNQPRQEYGLNHQLLYWYVSIPDFVAW